MKPENELWERIEAEREKRAQERAARSIATTARVARGAKLQKLLTRAGFGTKKYPILPKQIGPRYRGDLEAQEDKWAYWICVAAKAWNEVLGMKILEQKPIPDTGLGFEVARAIFLEAAGGESTQHIEQHLRAARKALGRWDRDPRSLCESELALAVYFRQLLRFLGPQGWAPPVVRNKSGEGAPQAPAGQKDAVPKSRSQPAKTKRRGRQSSQVRKQCGRPPSGTEPQDAEICKRWDEARPRRLTYEEFAKEHRYPSAREVKLAVDRHRKRQKNRPPQG